MLPSKPRPKRLNGKSTVANEKSESMTNPENGKQGNLENKAFARYHEHLESIDAEHRSLKKIDGRYLQIRTALFFVALCLLTLGYLATVPVAVVWVGWITFAAFFVAVVMNEPVREAMEQLGRSRRVAKRLIARVSRHWDKLDDPLGPDGWTTISLPEHEQASADDLDLLGRASLFQLVSMASTAPGIRTLASWLTGPADAETAVARRRAIETLAPMHDERLRFYSLAREVGDSTGNPDQFVEWAAGEPWLKQRQWLLTWANVSAFLTIVMLIAVVLGFLGLAPTGKIGLATLVVLAILNVAFTALFLAPAHEIFSIAMSSRYSVRNYQELFSSAEWLPSDAGQSGTANKGDAISKIRKAMVGGERSASAGMRDLAKVAEAGGLRQAASTFVLYLPLQAFALWDVRVLARLESWQETYRDDVHEWFDALGQLESLLSLAAIHDENPDWVFPIWRGSGDDQVVSAKALGHPLLADDERVCNDVSVGPSGTVLLVTGSNMSGKSTLLRSIGLNVALAGAGGPLCANEFSLPSVELATSIRVRDNLSAGVSFYMAELQRLKGVVDRAIHWSDEPDRTSLFLLDEILQGTNSRERQIAVVRVLKHLMESKAIGAISTHDLELADEPALMTVATTVHFRETIQPDADGNEKMTFDYKMRQGVSPTTNALRLLEMVGLGEDK